MVKIEVNERVCLEQIRPEDAPEMFQIIENQREYLKKWLPFVDETLELSDSESFIASIYADIPEKQELVFAIRIEGAFSGLIGFKCTDMENLKTEIGYWLSESFQKQGIMTACVKAVISYAFETMHLNRIQIRCAIGNTPSRNIPLRLGFQLEGIERDGERTIDGAYRDLEVYSLIRRKRD